MGKIRNFIVTIFTGVITYWIEFGLNKLGIIKKENLSVDFISWVIIFCVIYIIIENLSKIIKAIKNKRNKKNNI